MSSDAFWFALPCVLLGSVLGVLSANIYSKRTGIKDPQEVVIDEIAGQGLALLGIALVHHSLVDWTQVVVEISAAFALFRLFDIWKPWPIRRLEKLPGGWGIMADDLAAGAISALILALLIHLHWLPGL